MASIHAITPCLWFDNQAEEVAKFYTGIFKDSKIGRISRYPEAGREISGGKPGSVLLVEFTLDGQPFSALNGGPLFKLNEAISLVVPCDTQREIDYFWEKLGAGGNPKAQQCGWLKDKFGVSWQVVPAELAQMMVDSDRAKVERTMAAVLKMKKLDLAALKKAYAG